MSAACCCGGPNPYVCYDVPSPWMRVCHNRAQLVIRLSYAACKISGADCVRDTETCPDCGYSCEAVLVTDREASTAYDYWAPFDSGIAADVEYMTDEDGFDWCRVTKLLLPNATYDLNEDTGRLEKDPESGSCCYYIIGFFPISTRRIFNALTADTLTFDINIENVADGTCQDCACWNTVQTTDPAKTILTGLFGGYYFGAQFKFGPVDPADLGCIVGGGGLVGSRGSLNGAAAFGTTDVNWLDTTCYFECEGCLGTPDSPACASCSGLVSAVSGSCIGIYYDDPVYRCCAGHHEGINLGSTINCNSRHPYLDKIVLGDFACSDHYDSESCDQSGGVVGAVEN